MVNDTPEPAEADALTRMYAELAVEQDRERGLVDPSDLAELRRTAQEALGDGTPWSAEWEKLNELARPWSLRTYRL